VSTIDSLASSFTSGWPLAGDLPAAHCCQSYCWRAPCYNSLAFPFAHLDRLVVAVALSHPNGSLPLAASRDVRSQGIVA